jgi:two-component system sensor kinase FixL
MPPAEIRYWNPGAEALFGWPALAMIGRDLTRLGPAAGDEERALSQLLQEGVWQGPVQRRAQSGEIIVADVRRYLRYDTSGKPREVIEFARPASQSQPSPVTGSATLDGWMAASWEIDITPAQPILARIAELRDPADEARREELYHALVKAARIVEVNERAGPPRRRQSRAVAKR